MTEGHASSLSTAEEREFERRETLARRDRLVSSDVLKKIESDRGYREKVQLIEEALRRVASGQGWVLDVGSATSGEAEALATHGFPMIAMDVNEAALAISKERVQRFRRPASPEYVGGDAQDIPLGDGCVSAAIAFDSLHHLPRPRDAVQEIHRILAPGGHLFFFEPYAYNPYRRLSEVRDRLKGTIERSFGARELARLLGGAGFELIELERKVLPPSEWKRPTVSRARWMLRTLYYRVSRLLPRIFGNLTGLARKPGKPASSPERDFLSMLRCPASGAPIKPVRKGFLSTDPETRLLFPSYEGIPVLLRMDAEPLSPEEWTRLRDE
jgi:SAM-dependent methyltransferase